MTRCSNNLAAALSIAALMAAPPLAALAEVPAALAEASADLAPAVQAPEGTAQAATLTVTFSGIRTAAGLVMVALYDSQAAYDGGRPVRQARLAVIGGAASQTFEGLAPGTYAVKAFHDVNGDGRLGTNSFGIPTEPYAFSNGARGAMGPPRWSASAFEVKAGDNLQTIHID